MVINFDIWRHFERDFCETMINQKTSIFHSSKTHGTMARVTRLKVAVNISYPTCSFWDA